MKFRFREVPFWVIWATADSAALWLGARYGLDGMIVVHLAVVLVGWLWVVPGGANSRAGSATLSGFCAGMALLSPVIGVGVAGWLLCSRPRRGESAGAQPGPVVGNRARAVGRETEGMAAPPVFDTPLIASLHRARTGDLRGQIERIRRDDSPEVAEMLRTLSSLGDARTHLLAGAAMSSLREEAESRLRRLRRARQDFPENLRIRSWLAHALRANALAGTGNMEERRAELEEAAQCFGEVLEREALDVEALDGQAECLRHLERLDELTSIVATLKTIPEAQAEALRHECRLLCHQGRWTEVAKRLAATGGTPSEALLPEANRKFWLDSPILTKGHPR